MKTVVMELTVLQIALKLEFLSQAAHSTLLEVAQYLVEKPIRDKKRYSL